MSSVWLLVTAHTVFAVIFSAYFCSLPIVGGATFQNDTDDADGLLTAGSNLTISCEYGYYLAPTNISGVSTPFSATVITQCLEHLR